MRQPRPLLAVLLLLAMLPAVVGGSLTHRCACEGLMYIAGCSCHQISQQEKGDAALTGSCDCCQPQPAASDRPGSGSPAPASPPAGQPGSPHDCDYMAYQLSLCSIQAQLPPCPAALMHQACVPLPVWQLAQIPLPDEHPWMARPLPGERPRPLLI